MDAKKYEKLLAMVMEKLDQIEIEKNWLKIENERLRKEINKLERKEDVKQVVNELKGKIGG